MSVAFDSNVNLTVEVGFDSNPFDNTQNFTDISTYVREVTTQRGRVNELGQFVAGTATVVLSNADNRFNPNNESSPYYDTANSITKIQPYKVIRIQATYDSTTYPVWYGFLDTVPVAYPEQGSDSIVAFNCVDAFKLFNGQNISSTGFRLGRGGFAELGQTTTLAYVDTQELSSARVTRLLNAIAFPTSLLNIGTGTLQVQQQAITSNVLSALRECEVAENGQFFMAKDGKATFRSRNYRLSNTKAINIQATFSNDGTNLPYVDVQTSFDLNEIINVYEWTRNNGNTQFISDATSVQKYRPLTSSANTINVNDTDVASLIEQKIAQTALPQVRIDSLVVNPRQSTALWDNVLDLEFGDRISVKIVNPDNSSYTEELWIESISHRINASTQSWLYTITLSPATSSAWILGQAQLGLGTRFAYT